MWHIPTPEPVTARQFIEMVFATAGRPVKVSAVPSRAVRTLAPVVPLARQGADMIYQFEQPFIVDGARFRTAFGDIATGYSDGIGRTLAWYRQAPRRSVLRFGR